MAVSAVNPLLGVKDWILKSKEALWLFRSEMQDGENSSDRQQLLKLCTKTVNKSWFYKADRALEKLKMFCRYLYFDY